MKINTVSPDQHPLLQRTSNIAKTPKKLYYLGTLPSEKSLVVAIVGSRKPTVYGRDVTTTLATELARLGVIIVSGLAIGVDAIAHSAALSAGGKTIAVLPNGVDDPYPKSNQVLARKILLQDGALISEYEPGTTARQYHFLERNRIVSALSDAVIVTEAAIRSGTLSTVSHALEQGRTVFAVPGNITSPMSAGCNQLIKQGAIPLTSVQDVLLELGITASQQTQLALGETEHETILIQMLKTGPMDGDTLLSDSKLSSSAYSESMTMLEIRGVITPLGGNQWRLS